MMHAPAPATPPGVDLVQKLSLTALVRQQLQLAETASSGRSAHTVHGGHEAALRQTLVALLAGQVMEDFVANGEATVHVLHGHVRLVSGADSWDGLPGDLLIVPAGRASLEATGTSAVLLTVALAR